MEVLISLAIGYGLGSLPIGFLLARGAKGVDLRQSGSGNVGAANAYRTAGLAIAIAVVVVDVSKGAGAVALAARIAGELDAQVAAGVASIVGHVYPVWLRLHGGKGVATACGTFLVLAPLATGVAVLVFVLTVSVTRYVSLGSLVATAAMPPLAWALDAPSPIVAGAMLAALLIVPRHGGNLSRLASGRERRLGQRA